VKRTVAFPLALFALLADARVALADVEDIDHNFELELMPEENPEIVFLLTVGFVILIALVALVAIGRMRK
jgi:hypothetical protein